MSRIGRIGKMNWHVQHLLLTPRRFCLFDVKRKQRRRDQQYRASGAEIKRPAKAEDECP